MSSTSIMDNSTTATVVEEIEGITGDDGTWALLCALFIFTMQTGFAFLEMGCVTVKNSANIMIKNAVDVLVGGLCYWMIGYSLSFGDATVTNGFCGNIVDTYHTFFRALSDPKEQSGTNSAHYFFQLSFASTSTTIVSGAIAERMKLPIYFIYSYINVIIYCIPACWAWNGDGFLAVMGYYDYAGTSVVHLSGGASALAAAVIIGPRKDRFTKPELYAMGSPISALAGTFMLWWAWLGFNASSTFNVSGGWWRVSTSAAVTTLNGSIGGGLTGVFWCLWKARGHKQGQMSIDTIAGSILGGLVAVTGIASVVNTWEPFFIGSVGAAISIVSSWLLTDVMHVDDPVGAVAVHGFAGIWGAIAVGLHGEANVMGQLEGYEGLFHGGGFRPLGVQIMGIVCIILWSMSCTTIVLLTMDKLFGIRISEHEEQLGADLYEHGIRSKTVGHRLENFMLEHHVGEDELNKAVERLALFMLGKDSDRELHADKREDRPEVIAKLMLEATLKHRPVSAWNSKNQIKSVPNQTDNTIESDTKSQFTKERLSSSLSESYM